VFYDCKLRVYIQTMRSVKHTYLKDFIILDSEITYLLSLY